MKKKYQPKKRIIVDFKKLNNEILTLLVEKFPDGYGDEDVITFRNAKGETVEAVEVHTEDTAYLVKISQRLEVVMEEFEEDNDDYFESDEFANLKIEEDDEIA